LLLANFGKEGSPQPISPNISQETLAEMIGTTRSRVSHFMNKFRKLGFFGNMLPALMVAAVWQTSADFLKDNLHIRDCPLLDSGHLTPQLSMPFNRRSISP
jgi:hypothetical protein